MFLPARPRRSIRSLITVAAVLAGLSPVVLLSATGAHAATGDGTVTLRVIRDVAGNGLDDPTSDFGVAGVTYTVADASGATVSGSTGSDGTATINLAGLTGGRYRIEATPPANSGLVASPTTTGAGALSSLDSYVDVSGNKNVDVTMGVWDPTEYCQSNPDLVTCGLASNDTDNKPGVVTFSSNLSDTAPGVAQTKLTTPSQQGAVFGIGTDRSGNIFLGTTVKRHLNYGPAGAVNAIYRTNTSTGTVSTFTVLPGTLPAHETGNSGNDNRLNDDAVAPFVGRAGLGGLTVSGDGKTLYAVNLNDKRLYSIPIDGTGDGVSPGTVTSVAIPVPADCAGQWHPYGIGHRGMTIYVGGTCGAENTVTTALPYGDPSQVTSHIYRVTGLVSDGSAGFTSIWSQNMNYVRGCTYSGGDSPCSQTNVATQAVGQPGSAHWQAWNTRDPGAFAFGIFESAPQPMLASIAVQDNGDLVVGFKDRFTDIQGNATYPLGASRTNPPAVVNGINAGGIVRVCATGGTYVSEGSLPGGSATCGGTSQYYDTQWTDGGGFHDQTAEGAVATATGSTSTWTTRFDPYDNRPFVQGVGENSASGSKTGGQEIVASPADDPTGFGKGTGLAALQALCTSAPVQIGNRVWFDKNGNGIEDPDELPVPNVTVTLLSADGQTQIGQTKTDATGQYYFGATNDVAVQPNTSYRVRFDYSTADVTGLGGVTADELAFTNAKANGVSNRIDSDPSPTTGSLAEANVTTGDPGSVNDDIDAGLVQLNTIGDYVFFDRNRDGIQDTGDTPVPGVIVDLVDSSGKVIQSTTTGTDGKYTFTRVPDGTYTVHFRTDELPGTYAEFLVTRQNVGTDPTKDSNADANGDATVTVGPTNRDDTSIDLGLIEPLNSLGDYVFIDKDGNNVQSAGDTPAQGVTVKLLDSTGAVIATTTTDVTGHYNFFGLANGTYSVQFDLTNLPAAISDYRPVVPLQGGDPTKDSDADQTTGKTGPVTLGPGARQNLTLDMGLVAPTNSIGDYVFADANNDGIQDAGDTPISGVTVRLLDSTGAVVATQQTDLNGKYLFTNIPDGTYTVAFDVANLPAAVRDYTVAKPNQGTDDTIDSDAGLNGRTAPVTVGVGARTNTTIDLGLVPPVNTIGDFVFDDKNGNGIQDPGESGLEGVTVQLLDSTGKVVATTTTGPDGKYSFTGIPDGSYTVQFGITDLPAAIGDYTVSPPNQGGDDTKDSDANQTTGRSGTITVGVGDRTDNNVDLGLVEPGNSIGDYVFDDVDRNGVQSAADIPVAGVKVDLLDSTGAVIATTTSGADGKYLFTGMPDGTYSVRFDIANLPAAVADYTVVAPNQGNDDTLDSDASQTTGRTPSVTVGVGARSNTTLDLGLLEPRNSLGDYVFYDRNRDGIQDAGDTPIEGVTVSAIDANGDVVGITKSGPDGKYLFTGLPDGKYSVTFDLNDLPPAVADYVATLPNVGTNNAIDSDANPADGTTEQVTLGLGARSNTTLDLGLVSPLNSIGDYVFADVDRNGVQSAADTPVAGVKVDLLDATGAVVATTTSGADGKYLFTGLADGTYSVRFDIADLPAAVKDYTVVAPNQGTNDALDSDASQTTGETPQVTVGLGARSNTTLDLGLLAPLNTIGDFVFNDKNGNGIQDPGDTGLEGVTVQLLDSTGKVVATTTSGPDGKYSFTGIPDGTYTVKFGVNDLPPAIADDTVSPPNQGGDPTKDSNADPTTGLTGTVTVGVGARDDGTIDLGLVEPKNSIGDYVFVDQDRNGVQSAADTPVQGVTVDLLNAAGNVVATQTTGADGKYLFTGLDDGTYSVRFDIGNLPAAVKDYTVVAPFQGTDDALDSDASQTTGETPQVTVGLGARSNTTLDLGLLEPLNSLGDYVFYDRNGDGIQDAGDTPVPDVTVRLLDSAGNVVATTTTGADGKYHFTGLADGTYSVKFDLANLPAAVADFVATLPNVGNDDTIDSDANPSSGVTESVTLGLGNRSNTTLDLGLVAPNNSLGDYVFVDSNRDGIQDAGDSPAANVTVRLLNAAGDVIATTTTGTDGKYLFSGLPDGTYSVRFDLGALPSALTGYTATAQHVGNDGTIDSDADPTTGQTQQVTLGVDARSNPTLDLGLLEPLNTLGDYVFIDANRDGIQDAGDTPVEGVTVRLIDVAGDVIATTKTDADGKYQFAGLADGTYSVRFDLSDLPAAVAGYTATTQNVGTNTAIDSDGNPKTGQTAPVVLGPGARSNQTLDQGLLEPRNTLGDYVFRDLNRNGIQDAGDTPVAGVTVELRNAAGVVIATTKTGADGRYQFSDLPDGTYSVHFDLKKLPAAVRDYTATQANVGSNDAIDSDANPATGNTATVVLGPGARSNQTLDLGLISPLNTIGNYVFADLNRDGLQDFGDVGIAGVTVRLLDAAGKPVDGNGDGKPDVTTTDVDGLYLFPGLADGTYRVQVVKSTLPAKYAKWVATKRYVGSNRALDSDIAAGTFTTGPVTVGVGKRVDLTLDAGIVAPKSGTSSTSGGGTPVSTGGGTPISSGGGGSGTPIASTGVPVQSLLGLALLALMLGAAGTLVGRRRTRRG